MSPPNASKAILQALERSQDAVIGIDTQGTITFWNPAASCLYGYTGNEMRGQPLHRLVSPSRRNQESRWFKVFNTLEAFTLDDEVHRRKDGRDVHVSLTVLPIHIPEGSNTGACLIAHDLSEARLAEQRLRETTEELRNLSRHLQTVREEERATIAREMHDELGQMLTALKMEIFWLHRRLPEGTPQVRERIESMMKLINGTIQSVQKLCTELRPGLLDDLFLSAAVEWEVSEFQKRTGLPCRVRLQPEEISLDKECSTVLFRILQEALTNVARHSRAKSVEVSLERTEDRIVLVVRDDGIGISAEAINHPRSYGLIGMRERCLFWGGEVTVYGLPSPGHGTEVRVMMPFLK